MLLPHKKLAVIGNPISHSLSPQMHNAAIKALKLDLTYEAVKVETENVENFLKEARKDHLGFNVTVPNKNEIIKYLDEISDEAKTGNSVNTVKIEENGKAVGYSTDGFGLEMALNELFGIDIKNKSFLFLGCGGAAQAVSAHLLSNKAKSVCFLNRDLNKAEQFSDKLKSCYKKAEILFSSYDRTKFILEYLEQKPIVIQSTSIGLKENDPLIFPEECFNKELCYFDMIYKNTKFLETATGKGCRTGNGLLMLLYQGVKSFSIWTGIKPPVDIMKNAILKAIYAN